MLKDAIQFLVCDMSNQIKKNIALLGILMYVTTVGLAQTFAKNEYGIKASIGKLQVEVNFYSPSMARILKYNAGQKITKSSLSVIKQPQKVSFSVKQTGSILAIKTQSIRIDLDLNSGKVSFADPSGKILLQEKEGDTSFTPFDDAGSSTYSVRQGFALEKDEAIYGLGQQQSGKMIQRNLSLAMIQSNTQDYIPFFQSIKGYGLYWDNYSPTQFTDNDQGTSFTSEVGDCIDYYFMYGGNADGVIANMRDLTGDVPMFPLWTYGFWQSRERYKSQDELLEVVNKHRELQIPLDGIIQDWQYWGSNYLWNAMDFLNPEFPDPKKMADSVHQMDAHMIISIWNSFGPQTKQFKELQKINALMNFVTWPVSGSEKWPPRIDYPSGVKVYDAYNPIARDIYWKHLRELWAIGIDGWWMDSSEPDHEQFKPTDLDNQTYLGSFRKVRNAFPLMTVGGVYQHQRELEKDKRVFILTRSAFAGQQRFGANTWSGDIISSWKALRNQISAGLNFSLTGIPHWNSDIGGFFLWEFPRKLNDPEYKELYVRWLQFGTFCPMMRSHGADAPREIYQFGKGTATYNAIAKYIHLRYALLPYIYSTSWDVTTNRSSMMRALMMDFPSDKKALDLNDEFMFGKSILVSPITRPMYVDVVVQGKDTIMVEKFDKLGSKETYLPSGTDWYDFWTNEKLAGGKIVNKQTPLDIIPLYIKAGSIIPVGPAVQFAAEKKWDSLDVRIYPGANGKFVLYEDENDSYNYEKGIYSTITFDWNDQKRILTIGSSVGAFPGMLQRRTFNVIVVDANGSPGRSINYAGKKVHIKLD